MISSSFDRPERTASTASDARNRYKMRITTARMDASHLVNTYAQVSGTHTVMGKPGRAELGPHRTQRVLPHVLRGETRPLPSGLDGGEETSGGAIRDSARAR